MSDADTTEYWQGFSRTAVVHLSTRRWGPAICGAQLKEVWSLPPKRAYWAHELRELHICLWCTAKALGEDLGDPDMIDRLKSEAEKRQREHDERLTDE